MSTHHMPVPDPEYQLDEAAIAAAAAVFSARLQSLTDLVEDHRRQAQARFDADGLPRGLYLIERVA